MRRRAKGNQAEQVDKNASPGLESARQEGGAERGVRSAGPWDAAEHPLDESDETRIDLGSLSIKGHPQLEVRLQVDEASQQVMAVMLVAQDGAAELRAFAAPRNGDLWTDVRRQIAAEATEQGGTASEVDGPYGPALELMVTGLNETGETVVQNSAVWGISGPRWLLRASVFGRPVTDHLADGLIEQAVRDAVVIRGHDPMAPGEPLPLRLPPRARRLGDTPPDSER